MKTDLGSFFIGGEWQPPMGTSTTLPILNPATAAEIGAVALGSITDVEAAVASAKAAFPAFGRTPITDRLALLNRVLEEYNKRYDDFAEAITLEMGAPTSLSKEAQAYCGVEHLEATIKALEATEFVEKHEGYSLRFEPIGVCGLITPWNWPVNQIVCKVAPALAAGCTVVLKPSEFAPLSAQLFAEVMDAAGTPPGVFNMLFGDGPTVGAAVSNHPDIAMVSFTGSTTAGIAVAQAAATSVKRVSQELGGKSPIIVTDDVDLASVIPDCVWLCMENSGQSCNAGTRLLVPAHLHAEATRLAVKSAESYVVGDPKDTQTQIGPLANERQYQKVTSLLQQAKQEGLTPATGGVEPYPELDGFFVRPTIFAGLSNEDLIAREEIFGPVLGILPYDGLEEAITIANDTPYGLSAYIYCGDKRTAEQLATNLRAGMVHINGAPLVPEAPFGGYKQSGNGREWGSYGLHEFLEVKAVMSGDEE